jgi:putative flippase GtrA
MRAFERLISSEFIRFASVGALGFVVDAGFLLIFTSSLQWPPMMARVASFLISLVATWPANRAWTFRGERGASAKRLAAEAGRYFAVQLVGAAINFLVFSLMITAFGRQPFELLMAITAGSAAGLAVNYGGARAFVFAQARA